MKINFCGAVRDPSGYAEFSRYFVYALDKSGVEVGVESIDVDPKNLDYGKKGAIVKRLTRKINAEANVINMIPPLFRRYKQTGCPNIGFTMWEASRLPDSWVAASNEMDAIFVPCHWNKKVFQDSGVNVPVYVVQPGIDSEALPQLPLEKIATDEFKFYSIFQWTERKNPVGLVKAFLSEFSSKENVSLTLKTYKHARLPNNEALILSELNSIKKDLNIPQDKYPKINLITEMLSSEVMDNFHKTHDCFVLPHRSEGWGMPHMEAMVYGNPVISTNFSGNTDFMNERNSYLIPSFQTPVSGMSWYVPWYNGTMWWGEPSLDVLAEKMRYVFSNRNEARQMGLVGRKSIIETFNERNSSQQFVDAVNQVLMQR